MENGIRPPIQMAVDSMRNLRLGNQGEQNAQLIRIDVSKWLEKWPGAGIDLMLALPGEKASYPAKTLLQDGELLFLPGFGDTQKAGHGVAYVVATLNDTHVAVSDTVLTEILPKGRDGDILPEAPEAQAGWVADMLNAATRAEEAAERAENAGGTITDEQIGKAVEDYLQENPVEAPVQSVNGKTGAVNLTAKDVDALPSDTQIPAPYTLPTASASTKGGVKVGNGLRMNGDVLGVDVDEFEDIETFTTETDMGYPFERTAEPNGTPYNFRKLHVEITNPAWSKSLDKWPQVDTRNGERIQASWQGIISTSQAQLGYLVCEATPDGMLSIRSNVSPLSPSGNYTAIGGNVFDLASTPSNAIIRFLLWASEAGPIIAGTTIKIRGVRA